MTSPPSPYSGSVHDAGTQPPPPRFTVRTRNAARMGVTMGSTLAIVISWSVNHSILWAIVHGFLSWFYVIYYAVTR